MTNRRLTAALLHMMLPLFAGMAMMAGGWSTLDHTPIYDQGGTPVQVENYYDHILPTKPVNEWGTKDLVEAGFEGCVKVEDPAHMKGIPTAHVVRLPVAEGWDWVKMDAGEVAHRIENFGGTPSTKDDVKIVGNCY